MSLRALKTLMLSGFWMHCLQAVTVVYAWIQAWFLRLNRESGYTAANALLESPFSPAKVMEVKHGAEPTCFTFVLNV
jgi:hypothetical protein